jgi:hypothetical protein
MACHGCHQPADYDAMPPRNRQHPWSSERQTHVFSIAMLFAVETSSPMQRARNCAGSANGKACSFASWASLLSASASQQGPTWRWQTCTNISRHCTPVARARPTIHARLHPATAQRPAARRKPKRPIDKVLGSESSIARIGRHLRTANAYQGQFAIPATRVLNDLYSPRYRF